jgi:hypothetical protein
LARFKNRFPRLLRTDFWRSTSNSALWNSLFLRSRKAKPAGQRRITCTDDQGRVWWLSEDSEVGDWLDYVAKGGAVEPYAAPETQPTATEKG